MLMRHRKCQLTLLIPSVRSVATLLAARQAGGQEVVMLNNSVYRIPWTDATPRSAVTQRTKTKGNSTKKT